MRDKVYGASSHASDECQEGASHHIYLSTDLMDVLQTYEKLVRTSQPIPFALLTNNSQPSIVVAKSFNSQALFSPLTNWLCKECSQQLPLVWTQSV